MYAIWYGYDNKNFSFVRDFDNDEEATHFAEHIASWAAASDKTNTKPAFYHVETYEKNDEDQRKRLIEDATFRPEFATASVNPVN